MLASVLVSGSVICWVGAANLGVLQAGGRAGTSLFAFVAAAFPEVLEHPDAAVWNDTPKLSVAQMAPMVEVSFVNVHVHEIDKSTNEVSKTPLLDAILQLDTQGRLRSLVVGESNLFAWKSLETMRARIDAKGGDAAVEVALRRLFAEYPPSRRQDIEVKALARLNALLGVAKRVKLEALSFGTPPGADAGAENDLLWHVRASFDGHDVNALLEPLRGNVISVHITYQP